MNRKDLYQSFNAVDEDILVRSEKQKAKLSSIWLKRGTLAACFVVMLMTGTIMFLSDNGVQTSVGGVMRKYKNTSVSSMEEAIVWPWEYKTIYERYTALNYNGKEYTIKSFGLSVDKAWIGEKIGTCEAVGYDEYTQKEYKQSLNVWEIKGISSDLMIAAEMDGQYYTFKYNEYVPPMTLGDVLDNYSLSQNLSLKRFGVYDDGKENGYYRLADDDYIWEILEGCRDAQFVEDEAGGRISRDRITFTATSEALGVYKRVFYVTTDGYVSTNIFDWAYTFYIGEGTTADIISYAMKNSVKAEQEPYTYSLVGTLTEIGDGYILVDDSILCANEKDGMIFKVLTSDLCISRCIDYQQIPIGSTVVISFIEQVNVAEGNIVSGAISVSKGFLAEGEVAVPE